MKKLYISAVVEFRMKDRVTDELAKTLYHIERNQGSRFESLNKIKNLDEANSYLNRQFDRLRKYAKEGEFKKFDFLAKILLRNSKTYLLYGLNHSYEHWISARLTKIIKLCEKVIRYSKESRNELLYKRVWIDKKPGDYGRPLGVPEMADRIYGHMMTRIIEAYLCGTDQYSDNQHGGIPGRGVMTYLSKLAEEFPKNRRIFEFDIRGFFDHISHKAILEMFKSELILNYLSGVLKSKPTHYQLPTRDQDQQVPKFINSEEEFDEFFDEMYEKYREVIELKVPAVTLSESAKASFDKAFGTKWREGWEGMDEEFDSGKYDRIMDPKNPKYESHEQWMTRINQMMTEKLMSLSAIEDYKRIADKEKLMIEDTLYISERERELGRDKWKHLDLPDQGVPQGSSIGPVLSSVVLGKVLPKDSLIYMDDGIIFLGEKRTTDYRMITKVNKLLDPIGCELNPDKSGILSTHILRRAGLKILGMRIKRTLFNCAGMALRSETRKGTVKALFTNNQIDFNKMITELYTRNLLTVSRKRILTWYVQTGRLKSISQLSLVKLAESLGILGCILNRAMSPTTTLEEMKEQIEYGIFKAELKLKSSEGSLGERIINLGREIIIEGTESKVHMKPNLYTTRAIANNQLLRYLKGELPIRSLRVKGMRKVWKGQK